MGKTFLLFLLAGSLFAADPFVGTWIFNAAESKYEGGEGPALKEETFVFTVENGQIKVTATGTHVDGSPLSMKYTVPETGGALQWQEGQLPGITTTMARRKAGSSIIDFTDTKDGKVLGTGHAVVSADGKSLRGVDKTTDPQGKKYENVGVFYRQ